MEYRSVVFKKLTSVFDASVLLLIMNFVNIVKVAVDPQTTLTGRTH